MPILQDALNEAITQIPRKALHSLIESKIADQGIQNHNLVEALVDYVLDGGKGDFHFDDGTIGNASLSLEFLPSGIETLTSKINHFLEEDLPDLTLNLVKCSAKLVVQSLEKAWPELRVDLINESRWFKDGLELRWQFGLDPLRILLGASREIGEGFAGKLRRSKAKTGIVKREALMLLHARACQTGMEIITLLENGLADGAYSRWRTLHELNVVAHLIAKNGDELATRYLEHDVVSMHEYAKNHARFYSWTDRRLRKDPDWQKLDARLDKLKQQYGKAFATPYGWAADQLGHNQPKFQDLEEAVEWKKLSPDYKWSSYKVHAGAAGTIRSLSSIGAGNTVIAGASNAGLETPATNTAHSLVTISMLLIGKLDNLDRLVDSCTLIILRDKVQKQCAKAARKLARDEVYFADTS